jgi:hypothetical protein
MSRRAEILNRINNLKERSVAIRERIGKARKTGKDIRAQLPFSLDQIDKAVRVGAAGNEGIQQKLSELDRKRQSVLVPKDGKNDKRAARPRSAKNWEAV